MTLSSITVSVRRFFTKLWKRFASLSRIAQVIVVIVILAVIGGIIVLARGNTSTADSNALPTVSVASIDSFGGSSDGVSVLGTVQSVSEADLLAQSGGTVQAVHTTLGANVDAGFVIAELDSSSAAAAVLQAQGAYDAALAAEQATSLQSQNSTVSLTQAQATVRNTYQSTYVSLDSALTDDVGVFFGAATPVGPALLINPLYTQDTLPRERAAISGLMDQWQASLASESTTDPLTLLTNAQTDLTTVNTFLTALANLSSQTAADATPAQLASLATARATVATLIANITAAQTAYNASVTAAAVGQTQSGTSADTGVTSSEANVEEALGGLRSAQAAYEKTVIRAPISGTINYLPIKVGDYVTLNQHVATVARNNALEIVTYLSQDDRDRVAVGDTLTIDGTYKGVVTTIAPALDPTTKQIEVDIAVTDNADLVNGQSVQVALPTLIPSADTASTTTATTTQASAATVLLPLTAVKLLPNEQDIFTVDSTGHLVAHQVQITNVIGDRIQVTTPLAGNVEIVTDARGLSAGDAVLVSTSTSAVVSD